MASRITASASVVGVGLLVGVVVQLKGLSESIRQHNSDSMFVSAKLIEQVQSIQAGSIAKMQRDVERIAQWIETHDSDQRKYRLQAEALNQQMQKQKTSQ